MASTTAVVEPANLEPSEAPTSSKTNDTTTDATPSTLRDTATETSTLKMTTIASTTTHSSTEPNSEPTPGPNKTTNRNEEELIREMKDFDNLLRMFSMYRDNPDFRGNPKDKNIEEIAKVLSNFIGDDVDSFLRDDDDDDDDDDDKDDDEDHEAQDGSDNKVGVDQKTSLTSNGNGQSQ